MTRTPAGVKLICPAHGRTEWQDPDLRLVPGGFALGVDCALGGRPLTHWLAPDPRRPGVFLFRSDPFEFPDPVAAYAALEAYRKQSA